MHGKLVTFAVNCLMKVNNKKMKPRQSLIQFMNVKMCGYMFH